MKVLVLKSDYTGNDDDFAIVWWLSIIVNNRDISLINFSSLSSEFSGLGNSFDEIEL